ncbi:MAG: peptide chain release factor N(5)-glutamine methyltransferase [Flavobacteriaceae bacterium]|nr:peptide chain release factor N(5)-glutamine methyltransferase [Flavobacteriaceae bacterium]
MTIRALKNKFENELSSIYSKSEIDTIFFVLAEKLLHRKKAIIRSGMDEEWSEISSAQLHFDLALNDLKMGKPYQYVIGETEFLGERIFVNPSVLIPRPETEELAEWIINDFTSLHNPFNGNILDIGTGSGVLAISLKKAFPNAVVHAIDISDDALEVARNNSLYNQTPINFHQKDILKSDLADLPYFDIIVSNPPYIPYSEKDNMQRQVVDFEPEKALFVADENPTKFYFHISQLAQERLKPKGCVFLEIHQNFMGEIREMYEMGFAKVEVRKDISDNWRMLRAQQPYTCG